MGGIYLGNALLTHSKVENIIQDNDFYIKADGNNINWVDKEVCTLNISEPTNFTLNDILVAKQEYRDIILQIDNLDTNGVKITNYLVLESFNSNTLINQFSNDNFIATINSNATITLQKNIKAAPIEDYIVATDEGELTTELPETFGGRTADEYALKSDLENIGSGGGVTSWNDLTDKPFGLVILGEGDTVVNGQVIIVDSNGIYDEYCDGDGFEYETWYDEEEDASGTYQIYEGNYYFVDVNGKTVLSKAKDGSVISTHGYGGGICLKWANGYIGKYVGAGYGEFFTLTGVEPNVEYKITIKEAIIELEKIDKDFLPWIGKDDLPISVVPFTVGFYDNNDDGTYESSETIGDIWSAISEGCHINAGMRYCIDRDSGKYYDISLYYAGGYEEEPNIVRHEFNGIFNNTYYSLVGLRTVGIHDENRTFTLTTHKLFE